MQWEWFLAIWWLLRARARVCTYPIEPNDPTALCLNETSGTDSQMCNWTEKNKSKNISLRFISFDFRIIVTSFCCRWFHHSFFVVVADAAVLVSDSLLKMLYTAQYIVRLYGRQKCGCFGWFGRFVIGCLCPNECECECHNANTQLKPFNFDNWSMNYILLSIPFITLVTLDSK